MEGVKGSEIILEIFSETLRKYPPQPCLSRVATSECRIPGTSYVMAKGSHVYIPVIGIHNDPEIYPDPDRFDPDRMTREKIKARHPCSFIPFGMGKEKYEGGLIRLCPIFIVAMFSI